jgi:hypothetical protein
MYFINDMEFPESKRENGYAWRVATSILPRHDDSLMTEKMIAILAEK